jgi:hypothetical protein
MNASKTLTSLGAAAAALLLSTSIALASTAYAGPPPASADATLTVEGRGRPTPPTRPQPTTPGVATPGVATPGMGTPGANLPAPVDGPVPEEVVALITAGIEDEWHAYAVYDAVIDQFGAVRPFTNIQRAEAQHAAAWATIFERYDLPLPEQPVYDIPAFASLTDAYAAAADAEIANLDLYDAMLTDLAAYPDMVQVATALRAASADKHLPAFERCAGIAE